MIVKQANKYVICHLIAISDIAIACDLSPDFLSFEVRVYRRVWLVSLNS